MNFRKILKDTIRDAQHLFPNASPTTGSVQDWYARNQYVSNQLRVYGLDGDFTTLCKILNVQNPTGQFLKGRTLKRLGRVATEQGKIVSLEDVHAFVLIGRDLREMKFYENKNKVRIFDTEKHMKFLQVN